MVIGAKTYLRTENSVPDASGGKSRGHVEAPFVPVRGKLNGLSLVEPPVVVFGDSVGPWPTPVVTERGSGGVADAYSSLMVASCGLVLGSSWQR